MGGPPRSRRFCLLRRQSLIAFGRTTSWRRTSIGHFSIMRTTSVVILSAAILAVTTGTSTVQAASAWPQFRGPNASGLATSDAPKSFAPGTELWVADIAGSPSSPCVVGDRAFLTTFQDGKLWTVAVNLADGKVLWKNDAGAKEIEPFHAKEGSPAAATPASDGERVIVYFGSVGLIAYDFEGKELWRQAMPVAKTANDFGSGVSPIIAHGKVILVRDLVNGSKLFTFDAKNGNPLWSVERDGFLTGFATPIVWEHGGKKEIVVPGGLRLKSYDFETGAELWVLRNICAVSCTTPVASDDLLYFAGWSPAGEDAPMPGFEVLLADDADKDGALTRPEVAKSFMRDFFDANDQNKDGRITKDEWDGMVAYLQRGVNRLVAVRAGGQGDITETHVAWEKKKSLPYVPSPVLSEGRVFIVKDGGLASLFDATSGKAIYEGKRLGISGSIYASPVATPNGIVVATLDGTVALVSDDDSGSVLQKAEFKERIASTPSITDGMMLIRTATKLYGFKNR